LIFTSKKLFVHICEQDFHKVVETSKFCYILLQICWNCVLD